MNLTEYRESDSEQKRTDDLVRLIRLASEGGQNALDIGARDGHFSRILTEYFELVTALDLEQPDISHDNIRCVQGNIAKLDFHTNSFDLVFCAEVLEHIPPHLLEQACAELSRVSRKYLLIGVPYKQDIRVHRTTCYSCGGKNPPWGHVNSFDEERLKRLFPSYEIKEMSFVGDTNARTNFISTYLMDLAGNPYGTYAQDETCIHCNKKLKNPPERNLLQKVFTKFAVYIASIQKLFHGKQPNWIHILFVKVE